MHLRNPLIAFALLLLAPAAHAQYYIGGNAYNTAGDALLAQRIQTVLNYRPQPQSQPQPQRAAQGGTQAAQVQASVAAAAPTRPSASAIAALRFTPPAGGVAMEKFANDLGRTPEERKQLLQAIATTKATFEQQYAAKGWKNNVAGAFAFFIGTIGYVWSGREPDEAAQKNLFDALTVVLADSPDMAKASHGEKAELYDTLIASTSLPLLLYVDGSQNGNKAELEQARRLATEYSRKLMHAEPQALAAMLESR